MVDDKVHIPDNVFILLISFVIQRPSRQCAEKRVAGKGTRRLQKKARRWYVIFWPFLFYRKVRLIEQKPFAGREMAKGGLIMKQHDLNVEKNPEDGLSHRAEAGKSREYRAHKSLEGNFNRYKEQMKAKIGEASVSEEGGLKDSIVRMAKDGKIEIAENAYLKQIGWEELREGIEGFEHGEYQVVEALQPVTLYRAQSFDSPGGSYFSLEEPKDKLDTKIRSALSNVWADHGNAQAYNTREYIEQVTFPEGSRFYIGRIAGQETIGTKKNIGEDGEERYPLPGGAVQVVPFDADWVRSVGRENIKIKKFEEKSGFKEFSEKAGRHEGG